MSVRGEHPAKNRAWWPALVIACAAGLFCWPVFLGRIMVPGDMCLLMLPWRALQDQFPDFQRPHNPMFDPIQQYLPWRIYAVESLRAGVIPLWNPYAFCGTPFLANLQSTLLYPLNLLFLLTGARHGFGVSAILHLALGGLFMYAFLRTLALARPAALLGALVLMFNGFTVTWLEFPTMSLWVFMWLPAVLLCYERAVCRPRSLWIVLCAAAIGVQFSGGHLQISAYVIIALLIYAAVRVLAGPPSARGRARAAALAVAPVILGLALAAGQVLPTLELAGHTGRAAHGAAVATGTAFPLTHFVLYLVPNFFGNPVHYNYWGNLRDPSALNFFETACYVGILPLFLAAWGLRRWRDRTSLFFAALTIFAVLVAVGSPLYLLLYYLAPGFRELAGLGRALCLAVFGLAGLAAVGLDDLLRREAPSPLRCPVAVAIFFVIAAGLALALFWPVLGSADFAASFPGFPGYLQRQIAAFVLLTGAAAGLVVLRARLRIGAPLASAACIGLVLVDLFAFGLRFNPYVDPNMAYPETDSIRWLKENVGRHRIASLASNGLDWMAHNSPMVFGLRDIHGSDSLRVRRSFELVSGPQLDQASYPESNSPLLDALGVKYLITRQQVGEGWQLVQDADVPIYENLEALPRAYLAYDFYLGSETEGMAALAAAGDTARQAVLHPDEFGIGLARREKPGPVDPDAEVRFLRDGPNEVILETKSRYHAFLVLTDSYYPGWRAWVQDGEEPVIRANYGFRAVPVGSKGTQTVRFGYDPASFRIGTFISLLALGALSAAALVLHGLRPRSASATASRS